MFFKRKKLFKNNAERQQYNYRQYQQAYNYLCDTVETMNTTSAIDLCDFTIYCLKNAIEAEFQMGFGGCIIKDFNIKSISPNVNTNRTAWIVEDDNGRKIYDVEDYRFCLLYSIAKLKYQLETGTTFSKIKD